MNVRRKSSRGTWLIAVAVQCLISFQQPSVSGQQAALRHYDVADGLAHGQVTSIFQDNKGYLWFGTFEGLSRFDGYRFTNYTTADGLGHLIVSAIAQDRQGHLWVGTLGGGVAHLLDDPQYDPSLQGNAQRPTTRKKFVSFQVNNSGSHVSEMLVDKDDSIWCIADGGVYHGVADRDGNLTFTLVVGQMSGSGSAALADRQGQLWFGEGRELIEVSAAQVIKHRLGGGPGPPVASNAIGTPSDNEITAIAQDHSGRLFVTSRRELFEFVAPMTDGKYREQWRKLPLALIAGEEIFSMIGDVKEGLWIGTQKGLIRHTHGGQLRITKAWASASGRINALVQDREANLWIGTEANGTYKLSKEIIVTYTTAEGLPDQDIGRVFEDREGRIYALTNSGGLVEIVAGRAVPVPGTQSSPFNKIGKILLDSRDDWWVWPSGSNNLFRFRGLKPQFKKGEEITPGQGNQVSHWGPVSGVYEDRAGKIWISSLQGRASLHVLDPANKGSLGFARISLGAEFGRFAAEQARRRGQEPDDSTGFAISQMISDSFGALWLGTYGELGRLANGKLNLFEPTDGLPETLVRALFVDSRGSLWIGLRYGGLSMTKNPTAERPTFVNFSTRTGLASDSVQSVTEDNFGRIYIGTGRGLDQLDPATGRVRHFTTADGLAGTWVRHCMKDSGGNIWIATRTGLSRLNPQTERASTPPPVYLSRIHIAGEDLSLPETGTLRIPEISLAASRNNLSIEYVGLSFQGENVLRYQYKLEGIDQDWNAPTELRSVNYVRLPSGSYRFLVRAIDQAGQPSAQPAVMQFYILPPIWQRWWFVTLVVIAIVASGLLLHRFRVRQIVAVERIRRQVATDLHDDVGSGLAQIAILSEVAKRQATSGAGGLLTEVAELARSMRESMSEIVWAVDPRKDHLSDLMQRMRQAAFNLLEADGLPVQFHAPDDTELERVGLRPDQRRQLLLIFKEALTNVARHAQAQRVQIEVKLVASKVHLKIQDDGRGFELQSNGSGQGLRSLRQRADALRAQLVVTSQPGRGTTVELTMPLK